VDNLWPFALFIGVLLWILDSRVKEISKRLSRLEDFARLYAKVNGLKERSDQMDRE